VFCSGVLHTSKQRDRNRARDINITWTTCTKFTPNHNRAEWIDLQRCVASIVPRYFRYEPHHQDSFDNWRSIHSHGRSWQNWVKPGCRLLPRFQIFPITLVVWAIRIVYLAQVVGESPWSLMLDSPKRIPEVASDFQPSGLAFTSIRRSALWRFPKVEGIGEAGGWKGLVAGSPGSYLRICSVLRPFSPFLLE